MGESWIRDLVTSALGRAAEEKHKEEEAEVGVKHPRSRNADHPQKSEEVWSRLSRSFLRGHSSANTLVSDFWHPELSIRYLPFDSRSLDGCLSNCRGIIHYNPYKGLPVITFSPPALLSTKTTVCTIL